MMENEMLVGCLKGALKELQQGVDSVIESVYCDNLDDSFMSLLNSTVSYVNGNIIQSEFKEALHQWNEYEDFQNNLLTLIKISVRKGFLIGFNIKPTFYIM